MMFPSPPPPQALITRFGGPPDAKNQQACFLSLQVSSMFLPEKPYSIFPGLYFVVTIAFCEKINHEFFFWLVGWLDMHVDKGDWCARVKKRKWNHVVFEEQGGGYVCG